MVEIEGMRGYPLSCSTTAAEGMKVQTDTKALKEFRLEMLKLILSEHPSSCLICDERVECKDYQGTIRKTGVTTGCRFCPNDDQCELQDIIDKIGMPDIDYPILYHGFEPEHDDPFYDRDYNICILCGRCVRMCREVRGTSVLAFTQRGSGTKIGPAFGRSHREAGCEFCGACVDVCPTGALTDKASKWEGKPDGFHVSTCPFCAVGCQIELNHKSGRLTRVKAHMDEEVNDGQLCLKGRFCLPETTHHFSRAKKPMLKKDKYFREVTWEEALGKIIEKIKGIKAADFAMLVSPDLTNESLFAARKFVRECLKSSNLDSTARTELAGGPSFWANLFSLPISIKDITKSDIILAVGLDSRFDFSVVGTKVRQAIDAGAKLVTVDPRDSNLARYTDDWLRPAPGEEAAVLKILAGYLTTSKSGPASKAEKTAVDKDALKSAVETVSTGGHLTVILGPQVFHYGNRDVLADAIRKLAGRKNTNFIPLYYGANSRGALELGILDENGGIGLAEITAATQRPKVLYLTGDIPFFERPECDFLIVQDICLPPFEVDVFLPSSSFAESGGTLVNLEGRIQEIVQVEDPPEGASTGFMRPDWRIFSDLAGALNCHTMNYKSASGVFKQIRRENPGFPAGINRRPRRMTSPDSWTAEKPKGGKATGGNFLLVAQPGGYRHRGIDISSKVGGLSELALEEGFRMNPDDIESLGSNPGDSLSLSFDNEKIGATGTVKADPECPRGVVYFTRPTVFGGIEDRKELLSFYRIGRNPVRIEVTKKKGRKSGRTRT
jgi:predicted molibdopterin-dependent oxidoreductase YjgC